MKKSKGKQVQESVPTRNFGVIYYASSGEEQHQVLEALIQANRSYAIIAVGGDPEHKQLNAHAESGRLIRCRADELGNRVSESSADCWMAIDASLKWNINKSLHNQQFNPNVPLHLPGNVTGAEKPSLTGLISRLFYLKINAFYSPATERHNIYHAFLIEKQALVDVLKNNHCRSLKVLHDRIIQADLVHDTFALVAGERPEYSREAWQSIGKGLSSYYHWFFTDSLKRYRNKESAFGVRFQGLSRFLFAALFLVCLIGMPWLSKDYGITWDEKLQYEYAEDMYAYLTSWGEDKTIFDFEHKSALWQPMQYYGSFFDLLTVAIVDVFDVENVFELRHFLNAIFGVLGLLFCGLIAKAITKNWTTAFLAFLFLLLTPSYFGHSMNNPKDVPFATGFFMSVYFMILFIKQLPKPTFATMFLMILSVALAFSIRVGAILVFPYLLLFGGVKWFGVIRSEGSGEAFKQLPQYLIRFVTVLAGGWLLGCIFWPYALQDPIRNPLTALEGLSKVTYTTSYETFEGVRTYMSEVPWYYSLKWMLIGSALVVLAGFAIQIIRIPFSLKKQGWWNAMLLLMFLFPVYWAIHKNSMLYNGWRHWFFVYGNVAILAAMGWTWMLENRQVWMRYAAMVLILAGSVDIFAWMWRSHPNEYIYFNELEGGIQEAYGYYETDYYSNSMKEAVEWFVDNVDVNSKKLVVLTNNEPLTAQYYMNKYTDSVEVRWTREYELTKNPGDYAFFTSRTMSKTTLLEGYFPPPGTIHTIDLEGVPLCAIVKRENTYMEDGTAALETGRMEEAVQYFKAAAAYDPGNEEAWRHLGLTYANMGKDYVDSALKSIEKAIEVLPESFIAYDIAGMIFSAQEKYDTAIYCFKRSVEYKINYTNAHYNMAIAYYNTEDFAHAAEEFENSIRYGGQKPQFYKLLGASLAQMNRLDEAIQYLTYAAQNSNDWEAYNFLGLAYESKGDAQAAQQMYAKAQQLRGK